MEKENKVYSFIFTNNKDNRITEKDKLNIKNPTDFLKNSFKNIHKFGTMELLTQGNYKQMGWQYDFKPYLKKFLVKQYNSWQEYYCLNKTTLRKLLYGKIQQIVEIEKEGF